MGWPHEAFLYLRQITTPKSRPANGGNLLYTKSDNNLYLMNADGTEHAVSSGGGGGSSLTVQDENANVATAVTQIDFQGAGVTASAGTGEVVVTVPGETLPQTIIDAKGDLIVGTAADTAARLAVGTDGQVLTADSTQAGGIKWSTLSGGGSGNGTLLLEHGATVPSGTAVGTIIFEKAGGGTPTTWDFRSLSALPSGWARRGITSETFAADGMSATYNQGQAHYYTLPAGVASGTLEVKLVSGPTTGVMLGPQLFCSDGSGGAGAAWYSAPSGCLTIKLNTIHEYGSSFTNGGGAPAYPVWFRVRYATGNAYSSYSMDGTTWSTEAALALTLGSLTEIAIGSAYASATAKTEYAKWTPASSSGGLKGWWDGTTVVSFA